MSAALTFYTLLSLAPLLMIAVAIAGYIYDGPQIRSEIVDQVRRLTDDSTASIVAGLIANATKPSSGIVASTISILISLFGASGVFSQLYGTFNDIWNVPNERRQGCWFLIKQRIVGLGVVATVGITLLAMLVISSIITYLNSLVSDDYPRLVEWLTLADSGLVFLLMPVIFTAMFWILPATKVSIRDVWPAGLLTAFLVSGSRFLVNFYLQFSTTSQVYGVAGSLVVLMIWVYIIGLCVFFGASFSYSWAHHFGSKAGQPMTRFGARDSADSATIEVAPNDPTSLEVRTADPTRQAPSKPEMEESDKITAGEAKSESPIVIRRRH